MSINNGNYNDEAKNNGVTMDSASVLTSRYWKNIALHQEAKYVRVIPHPVENALPTTGKTG